MCSISLRHTLLACITVLAVGCLGQAALAGDDGGTSKRDKVLNRRIPGYNIKNTPTQHGVIRKDVRTPYPGSNTTTLCRYRKCLGECTCPTTGKYTPTSKCNHTGKCTTRCPNYRSRYSRYGKCTHAGSCSALTNCTGWSSYRQYRDDFRGTGPTGATTHGRYRYVFRRNGVSYYYCDDESAFYTLRSGRFIRLGTSQSTTTTTLITPSTTTLPTTAPPTYTSEFFVNRGECGATDSGLKFYTVNGKVVVGYSAPVTLYGYTCRTCVGR